MLTLCKGLRTMAAPPHPDGTHLGEGEPALRRVNAAAPENHAELPAHADYVRWCQVPAAVLAKGALHSRYPCPLAAYQLHDFEQMQTLTPLSPYWSSTKQSVRCRVEATGRLQHVPTAVASRRCACRIPVARRLVKLLSCCRGSVSQFRVRMASGFGISGGTGR